MKAKMFLILAIAGFILALALFAAEAPNLTGTWVGKVFMEDGSADGITVVFTKNGETYAATVVDEAGLTPDGTELKDIKLVDKELTFNLTTSQGALINVDMKIEGDSMTGNWQDLSSAIQGPVEMARQK